MYLRTGVRFPPPPLFKSILQESAPDLGAVLITGEFLLGAVQRDGQHVAVAFEQAVVAVHRVSLTRCRRSKSSSRGRRISSRKRSQVNGHAVGSPVTSRYQLRQPLFQIVFVAATRRSASKRAIASGDGLTSPPSPART